MVGFCLLTYSYFGRQSGGQGNREPGAAAGARHPPLLIQRGRHGVHAQTSLGDHQKGTVRGGFSFLPSRPRLEV
jgi:hypothetical protein